MKKISLLLVGLLSVFLVACSNQKKADGKLNIVTTFYPVYEFTKQVAGDEANVDHMIMNLLERRLRRFRTQMPLSMKMKIWKLGYQICSRH